MSTDVRPACELSLTARGLNAHCYCITMDECLLRDALACEAGALGLETPLAAVAQLFSRTAVFADAATLRTMRELIAAVERVATLPRYVERALADAHPHARVVSPTRGVFFGYDFHLSEQGPQLIEINTNAGGGLLNALLRRVQRVCCEPVAAAQDVADPVAERFVAMFRTEWRLRHPNRPLRRIALVDASPATQYLYPEFLLFQRLLEREGIETVICDPTELHVADGQLCYRGLAVDLVYNRLTDFLLTEPDNAALAQAWRDDLVVVTPHPRAYALLADKRRLITLSDPLALAEIGARDEDIALLVRHVPVTVAVDARRREAAWAERKQWFFKPHTGYGSKAAYRGDKLTRGVFERVLTEGYVAQRVVPPSTRSLHVEGDSRELKVDVRNFAYAGDVQLVCARLYAGQTTNFRTPGGGFAPVYETVS